MRKLLSPAECTIRAYGGVRALARALGIPASGNVSRWLKRGLVPGRHHKQLLEMARMRGLDLTAEDLVLGRWIEVAA